MTPLEATARAREAVLAAVARGLHAEPDLVAVCEAAGGLCPRKGRALLRILVRARLLADVDGALVPGPRGTVETAAHSAAGGVRTGPCR